MSGLQFILLLVAFSIGIQSQEYRNFGRHELRYFGPGGDVEPRVYDGELLGPYSDKQIFRRNLGSRRSSELRQPPILEIDGVSKN